ncbi:class I SAM-dependent methyltransferase [Streptomyces profundus]|uniref:class I SAM-dependent methyltransferase n=1 Tax=Streptomyces profundus TaxID=2867410 RepID=UPI001D162A78|nr:class I SAM-dependent methyltransferase [Streptomyces sp. MA3_2.13]UED88040.1 class I SAM-dependent methyltransferase [Streptomyces sp. MA3_2.13]
MIFPALGPDEIEWLSRQLRSRESPSVIEFGVGTGRVLVPFAERLADEGVEASLIGVDASREMLDRLAERGSPAITPRLGNMCHYRDGSQYDLALCVCGSLAILPDPQAQQDALRTFSEHLRPGGLLVTETHGLPWVRGLGENGGSVFLRYPGVRRGMVVFSELEGERWDCKQIWIDDEDIRVLPERALLIAEDRLLDMAEAVGLRRVGSFDGLGGKPYRESSMTMATVFEKSA